MRYGHYRLQFGIGIMAELKKKLGEKKRKKNEASPSPA
jgi:hypothetical protein